MHNPESFLENETQNSPGFCDTNRSPNPDQKTKPNESQQKKENLLNCILCGRL